MVDVSVIVPVYNARGSLERCLDSVIGQKGVEIEIICIDDKSVDGSEGILNAYQKRHANIKVMKNPVNSGAGYSRNRGIRAAEGRYVQFLDADDYLLPDSVSSLCRYGESWNAQICFLKFEQDSMVQASRKGIEKTYAGVWQGRELAKKFIDNKEFFYYACGAVYRRDFLMENGIEFSDLEIGEGGDFVLHCLMYAGRASVYDGKCYHYTYNPQSVTTRNGQKSKILLGQIYQYVEVLRRTVCKGISGWGFFLEYQYGKIKGGMHNLDFKEWNEVESRFKDDFSKHMVSVLVSDISYQIDLSGEQTERLKRAGKVAVYGAGYAAHDILQTLSRLQVEIIGFAVTDSRHNPKSLFGHHVYEIGELKEFRKEILVVIAANKKYNKSIEQTLDNFGFDDRLFLDIDL